MNLSKTQIEQILQSSEDFQNTGSILGKCMENEENSVFIIEAINKLLSKSNSLLKGKGLAYLNQILPYCSKNVLRENVLTWIGYCLLNNHPKNKPSLFRLNILGNIIKLSSDIEELHKEIATNYVSKILNMCLEIEVKRSESLDVLKCVKQCLLNYSSAYNQKQLESLLLLYLHEELPITIVKEAALCLHYLLQVGFPGFGGKNYSTNWSNQMDKLCATVHELYNIFFSNDVERFNMTCESIKFPEPKSDMQENERLNLYLNRILNCTVFIKTMLEIKFNAQKDINLFNILCIIQRAMSEHRCLSKAESLNSVHFSILLIKLQMNLLVLLRSLMACLGSNLLIFSFAITKVFMDCILVMETCDCLKMNRKFLAIFCIVLNEWLLIVKNNISSIYQDKLLKFYIAQLEPEKSEVKLSLTQNMGKSKKAKHKAMTDRIIASSIKPPATNRSLAKNDQIKYLCSFVLDSLKQLLICVYLDVKPETLQALYNMVIKILIDVQTGEAKYPYTNEKCQEKLYEVLVMFFEHPNLSVPPPIKLCIRLLTKGRHDHNSNISYICMRGLHVLEKIGQPVCPSLYISQENFISNKNYRVVENTVEELRSPDILSNSNLGLKTSSLKERSSKGINIIDIQIIPPSNSTEVETEKPELVVTEEAIVDLENENSSSKNNTIVVETDDEMNDSIVIETKKDNVDEDIEIIVTDDKSGDIPTVEIDSNKSIDISNAEAEVILVVEKLTGISNGNDEPATKRSKTDVEEINDSDLESVMETFVDEVNDY